MVMSYREVQERISHVRLLYRDLFDQRRRVRAIIDGGQDGLKALLGPKIKLKTNDIPALNMFESGANRLAHELGLMPDIKTDPFPTARGLSAEDQRNRAEKRKRIIEGYDHHRLPRQLQKAARWMPVYSYAVWVITERVDAEGNRFPVTELRDPYYSWPSWWDEGDQPEELVTIRRVPQLTLARLYPDQKAKIMEASGTLAPGIYDSGRVEQITNTIAITEYHDYENTYILMPETETFLDVVANPLTTGPKFTVGARTTFNKMTGMYDNAIGLLAHMAKLNVLALIATEDAVLGETNIFGGIESIDYERGRGAINHLPLGANVDRPNAPFPAAAFEQLNRLERMLRTQISYPVAQDGISPNSFVTGEGLDRLADPTGKMVQELRTVMSETLELIDAKRLEWDEIMYPNGTKPLRGIHDGAMVFEEYTPAKDIAGEWQSRREYGPMTGIDEPTKIVAGLQLFGAGVIDMETFREMLHDIGDLDRIRDNVRRDNAEQALFGVLSQMAAQGDAQATLMLTNIFDKPGNTGEELVKFFTPAEPQVSPEEEEFIAQGGPAGPPAGAPPPVQSILAQLNQSGDVRGGSQTVATG